jgi:hypothetical protein
MLSGHIASHVKSLGISIGDNAVRDRGTDLYPRTALATDLLQIWGKVKGTFATWITLMLLFHMAPT